MRSGRRQVLLIMSHIWGVTIDGVWIGSWIYWPLIHTTRNCKSSQRYRWFLHTAHAKHFPACCALINRSLATASSREGFAKLIIHILLILCYRGSVVTLTVLSLTVAKFKPFIITMSGFAWSYTYCEHVHSHDFVWLMLVVCTIMLYNRIHTESWKPCANCEPLCPLENFQWCGEPCFVGAAILRGRCLSQIPRRGKHKSLLIWSEPNGGLV
jgi:hypothetical protein